MDPKEFINIWLGVIKGKYADFSGRARRKEYWSFFLVNFVIGIVIGVLGVIPGVGKITPLISLVFNLAILVPSIAVAIRRLHDIDRSGWFLLLGLIPLVGLVLIYFFVQPGTSGKNQYGPDPKAAA